MDFERALESARRGDVDAYGDVVRRFEATVRTYVAAYWPDRNMVDEIAQKAFIWAYEHLDEFRPGTRFGAWIKEITRRILLSELEIVAREGRNRRKYLEALQAGRLRESLSGSEADTPEAMADALRHCLEELPPESRTLVSERYEERRTLAHLARSRGREPGTIKVTLFRIRQALRRCVERRTRTAPAQTSEGA